MQSTRTKPSGGTCQDPRHYDPDCRILASLMSSATVAKSTNSFQLAIHPTSYPPTCLSGPGTASVTAILTRHAVCGRPDRDTVPAIARTATLTLHIELSYPMPVVVSKWRYLKSSLARRRTLGPLHNPPSSRCHQLLELGHSPLFLQSLTEWRFELTVGRRLLGDVGKKKDWGLTDGHCTGTFWFWTRRMIASSSMRARPDLKC